MSPLAVTVVRSLALLAALIVAGCQAGPVATSPAPSTTAEQATQEELAAIKFRTENGLRNDLAHVRAVAADPTATDEFGIPLLPVEVEELFSRSANVEEIIPIIQAEGAKAPNDYCGLFIDNANGGALTSGWKNNLLIHEVAIRSQVQPGARLAFVDCRFSEVELTRVCDRLRETDHGWMQEIPAMLLGWGCGNRNFRVEMQISSAVPDAPARVLQHYAGLLSLPEGILVVESDGTGVSLVEWGTVNVFVTRPDGSPVGDSGLMLLWSSDVAGLECGRLDVGFGVRGDGEPTELPCQEGRWTIQVAASIEDVYGEGTVVVQANKAVDLRIRLDRDPPPIP